MIKSTRELALTFLKIKAMPQVHQLLLSACVCRHQSVPGQYLPIHLATSLAEEGPSPFNPPGSLEWETWGVLCSGNLSSISMRISRPDAFWWHWRLPPDRYLNTTGYWSSRTWHCCTYCLVQLLLRMLQWLPGSLRASGTRPELLPANNIEQRLDGPRKAFIPIINLRFSSTYFL